MCFAPQRLIWPLGSAPSALASLFFDPPEPQIIQTFGTTKCLETSLPVRAPASSVFWLSLLIPLLFSDFCSHPLLWLLPSLLFICPYCRKVDFKKFLAISECVINEHIYIYIYISIFNNIFVCVNIYIYIYLFIYLFTRCIYACADLYTYICAYVYVM